MPGVMAGSGASLGLILPLSGRGIPLFLNHGILRNLSGKWKFLKG